MSGVAMPQATVALVKRCEGFHRVPKNDPGWAQPYICPPAGFWTIGYRHLCDQRHPLITETEVETGACLAHNLSTVLAAMLCHCPVLVTEPEGRWAVIVDFTFNLGGGCLKTSTLRRCVNQRDWAAAATELRRWVYGGGKVLPDLVARRMAEVALL